MADTPALYTVWKRLVVHYQVKGTKVHDARLVAAAVVHVLTHILTFNGEDFRCYDEIDILHPNGGG